ncbi:MAG: transcription-repair coupling factor [Acidimicrobiales bacterium]|nr:transcription-repair coupling factor [Acidimicrobiales bacterium]
MNNEIYQTLPELLKEEPSLVKSLGLSGVEIFVPECAHAIVSATISRSSQRKPLVVVAPTNVEAEKLFNDLKMFLGFEKVDFFPSWETLPFERISPGVETMGKRLRVLHRLVTREETLEVIVTSARALVQKLSIQGQGFPISLKTGDLIDQGELLEKLFTFGYKREYQVEHRGEVAVRGSIIDIWPSTTDSPVRVDLWGDEIERLCEFGVADQRTKHYVDGVEIFPCRELVLNSEMLEIAASMAEGQNWGSAEWERLANGELFDGMESFMPWLLKEDTVLADILPKDGLLLLIDRNRLDSRVKDLLEKEKKLAESLAKTWSFEGTELPELHVSFDSSMKSCKAPIWFIDSTRNVTNTAEVKATTWESTKAGETFHIDVSGKINRISELLNKNYFIVVTADGEGSANRLEEIFQKEGLPVSVNKENRRNEFTGIHIVIGSLERGFILENSHFALITENEVTGRRRTHKHVRERRKETIRVFEDFSIGDYVVHKHHGIARFAGLVSQKLGGSEKDYLLLEYKGSDRLYLPTDQIEMIRPYSAGDVPTLSRMGGIEWERTKSRVKSAISEIASDLVELYKKRINSEGRAFAKDSPWQSELEQSFPFQETPDQLRAIEEVKIDMERPFPMDRVICGDVGFGKTEVALRAAFKAVQDGCQVAILVPTTLLAQQHGETFKERLVPYPIRVEVLSRFLTQSQARKVLSGLEDGSVDIVIGTHRLLSQDVSFKDLGLLIVDEEQRFGVSHKEAIKAMKAQVDILTLTATPIPRTLEMSLTGIRDLSLIDTPPADRQPILTFVGEYNESAVVEAIRRELLREGQVFFVHNRVHDIDETAAGIKQLVPDARVAVAHGQMDESSLEKVIIDFWERKYDVLVCTTIVESGIDMPTVNTLVVDRADLLGLGQLHQLRGRVGRSGQRAYAYLFTPIDRSLSEEAFERLRTIGETTELGSGFRLAMKDLEIRGAGNLLGTGQSGHVASVGYDLYCQMVNEAVAEASGVKEVAAIEIRVEMPVDAYLPENYVARSDLRLEAYRKLASAGETSDPSKVEEVRQEWEDRYGPIPEEAEKLLAIGHLRTLCVERGVKEVTVTKRKNMNSGFLARCSPVLLPLSKQTRLERLHPEAYLKESSAELQIPIPEENPVEALSEYLKDLVPVPTSIT